jgi:hypothetical protein
VTEAGAPDLVVGDLLVRARPLEAIGERTLWQWAELEQQAIEPNAYLSPRLVLPAARHLVSEAPVWVLTVERPSPAGNELVALGVFESIAGSRHFPLPHLRAFRSPHSYLSGLLVHAEASRSALQPFFRFLCDSSNLWHGVVFYDRSGDGALDRHMMAAAADNGAQWFEQARMRRAIFVPAEAGEDYVAAMLGNGGVKDLRRRRRRLDELGSVEWRVTPADDPSAVERFIDLEHLGWKGRRGRSLKARRGHAKFFEEMAHAFGVTGDGFFTELSVEGRTIGSTINLISGDVGFAFKLGWDPAYARYSPGLINEVELVRNAPRLWPQLRYFDSGADEGSFIERLWKDRRTLVSGVYATTPLGKQVARGLSGIRRLKRWLRGWKPVTG